jgi:hypothetical protein
MSRLPNTILARPCDVNGVFLPPFSGPPPPTPPPENGQDSEAWAPFEERLEFDFAQFHFVDAQSSEKDINKGLDLWAASVLKYGGKVPWKNAQDLYATIDSIQIGDAPWKTYTLRYSGPRPPTPPKWMTQTYDLCTRDVRHLIHQQLATTAFKDHINLVPYRQFNQAGRRVWSNLMSGDWAWNQAVCISFCTSLCTHEGTEYHRGG